MKTELGNWPVWMTVAILGLGALVSRVPLSSVRPEAPTLAPRFGLGDQQIVARLWRDPLIAIQGCDKLNTPPSAPKASGDVVVIPILVPGGAFPVDSELRLRARYAVTMAMLDCGYAPKDADRLGRWDVRTNGKPWTTVAFEWWTKGRSGGGVEANSTTCESALLVWMSEDDLLMGDRCDLGQRFADVMLTMSWGDQRAGRVAILGPCTSDGLVGVCESFEEICGRLEPFQMSSQTLDAFCPYATIANDALRPLEVPENLKRTIATDAELAELLVDELAARHVIAEAPPPQTGTPCENQPRKAPRIVLLSEYDTAYGRNWPKSFSASLRGKLGIPDSTKVVDQFFYLRGLDEFQGSTGRGGDKSSSAETKDPVQPLLRGQLHAEKPAGNSQFDYVRRLARAVEDSQSAADPIVAIGICGTDVFDKLLLLQAFRDVFPGRVFFTTDLDSALLMPDQYRWTRNVIVASSYDLRLGATLQGQAPPFRDCYQTALFLSAKRALGIPTTLPLEGKDFPPPRVYEIGRSGPFDLLLPFGGRSGSEFFPDQPSPTSFIIRNSTLTLLGLAILLLLLLYVRHNSLVLPDHVLTRSRPGPHSPCEDRWPDVRRLLNATGIAGLLIILGWLMLWFIDRSARDPHAEPFAVFEGVSVWPTEIIRVGIGIFAFVCARHLSKSWAAAKRELREAFRIPEAPPESPKRRYWVLGWRRPMGAVVFADLWNEYESRADTRCRFARVGLLTATFFVMGVLLFKGMFMPPDPIRGNLAIWDDWIVYFCVLAMLLLNFLVWDATRLCARFIRLLTTPTSATQYPPTMLNTLASVHPSLIPSLLDTRLVGCLTERVGRAVYYPLMVIFFMILARSQVFDNWQIGLPLVIVVGGSFVITFVSGLGLRKAAETCRSIELTRLRELQETVASVPGSKLTRAAVQEAIVEIGETSRGAFARFKHDPILGPLLVPASGSIALLLIDYLANRF